MTDRAQFTLEAIASGGKAALSKVLAQIESAPDAPPVLALLDAAYATQRAHVIGITGPPGVGKSTLLGVLIARWRQSGRTVGVIAVDPSSRISGGALLGDRTRLRTDPEDRGVFVRSMAARDKLGGLAALSISAMVLMRALFDIVLIETVGVGQSESDIAGAADTVVLCIQPGAGDALQLMKAGIVEIPHVVVVTKGDLGHAADRSYGEVTAMLGTTPSESSGWVAPVIKLSALTHDGIASLENAMLGHWDFLCTDGRLPAMRQRQASQWVVDGLREAFGREGIARMGEISVTPDESPFRAIANCAARLRR